MSSKSKSRLSVFDRLGPGNDEQPVSATGRRFSEKHQSSSDKPSRHSYPLSSPEPVVPRERKPSDYDDKKHVHYREGTSRPRPAHPPALDHSQDSDEDERYERRKLQSRSHKSGSKSVRGPKHRAPSSESQGSGSEGESGKEGSKRRKKDSERRSKHGGEGDGKRRHYDRKDKPEHSGSTPSEVKGRSRGKDVPNVHESSGHKRRKEEDFSESRYGDRKRKHEDDAPPYEYKKPRLSDSAHQSPHREQRSRAEMESRAPPEHRRRRDPSPRERKHPRSRTPEATLTSKKPSERVSPLSSKKPDKKVSSHEKKISSSNDLAEDEPGVVEATKALDWDYLSSYTQRQTAKLAHSKPRSALERFTPGALFARVGVSPSLAGPDYYNAVSGIVSSHLQLQESEEVTGEVFGGAEFAAVGLSRVRKQRDWKSLFKTGECRRALTASDDYAIRRKLRKQNQSDFLPRIDTPPSWESQLYSTGVALYHSLGKKSSGKPAYRVQESRVGELLVAR